MIGYGAARPAAKQTTHFSFIEQQEEFNNKTKQVKLAHTTCPKREQQVEQGQGKWNGIKLKDLMEWSHAAADGPPAYNPQQEPFKPAPSSWIHQ